MSSQEKAYASLVKHAKKIDILISQAYRIEANGMILGYIDPQVTAFTQKNNIKLMALITNVGFDKKKAHQFLQDEVAQERALETLLQTCKQQHHYGIQLDFEMIPLADKDKLTHFYKKAAELFHKNGFIVSFAVAPVVVDEPIPSDFLKKIYENWEGAYDLKALGEAGDFVTVMAYNQHAGKTTPGSTAGIRWTEAVIKHTLHEIPADKISLGIPLYSEYWTTSENSDDPLKKIEAHAVGIGYEKVKYLVNKFSAHLEWDAKDKNYYTFYQQNWLNEFIFIEDVDSFQGKLALIKKYKLRGFSAFNLGVEDPKIWRATF
jgi:spore germination protein YaaH